MKVKMVMEFFESYRYLHILILSTNITFKDVGRITAEIENTCSFMEWVIC